MTTRHRAADRNSFDYIIVGAGSSGCVIANRLTGDADTTVLLPEAAVPTASLEYMRPTPG